MTDNNSDYLNIINDVEDRLYKNKTEKILNEIDFVVKYMANIQKRYNVNKADMVDKIGLLYTSQTDNNITEIENNNNFTSPSDEINIKSIDDTDKKYLDKFMKKIYLNIAKQCHPDKTKDKYLHKIFNYAKKSRNDNNIIKMIFITNKNCLKNIELKDEEIVLINNEIEILYKEIENIKKSIPYIWSTLDNNQKKQYVVDYHNKFGK